MRFAVLLSSPSKAGRSVAGESSQCRGRYARFQKNLLFSRMLSMLSSCMAQLLVRDLEEEVVQALRQKAAEEGTSVEEAHRRLLRSALLSKKNTKTFKEALLEMPDDGDDSVFERVRRKPRKVVL
jgi:plasmid stability protein